MSLSWNDVIGKEKEQDYFKAIMHFVSKQRKEGIVVYPPTKDVFNAFKYTEFDKINIVILGQDPYHGAGQAHGLSFSVLPGVAIPPSLANMYKELMANIEGFSYPEHGCLISWAQQGVLLLNTVLTVEAGKAHSHANLGWETFTDNVISAINHYQKDVIFLLWGAHAQKKEAIIDRDRHHVLTAPHPSPLSAHRGFLGCRHFIKANEILATCSKQVINWQPILPKEVSQ